jgi:hypothetical protein
LAAFFSQSPYGKIVSNIDAETSGGRLTPLCTQTGLTALRLIFCVIPMTDKIEVIFAGIEIEIRTVQL